MTAVWDTRPQTEVVRTVPYTGDGTGVATPDAIETVRSALREEGIVIVRGFPAEAASLVAFSKQLGKPEPGVLDDGSLKPDEPMYWINDITHQKKGGGELTMHTAGSHAAAEPRIHLLLMVEKSDLPVTEGETDNGQSQFARVDDAVARMSDMFGSEAAEAALSVLLRTPISTEFPEDAPRVDPFLTRATDGTWSFRYWRRIKQHAANADLTTEQIEALHMFDQALNAEKFEFALEKGDLVVLDNHRTAHGRREFPAYAQDADGNQLVSKRRIFNMHIAAEI
ncbi:MULTISPECIES: TauD/TfdA family dioxygenase [unclassified Amycolatopsis]|uniref:TauD/TfdA family dioxygenase n=1 Tax=unclassified Amycolatopsis TaxID=2618356 RepID=UPI0028745431|nr:MULTISPECIES: TauD/TfdA family dioxygenase [unclassified Amycolatopsis]MDS0139282.1 TauD/TfdA family dioxygenase [Amycolatopsis sp. 505]MDS0144514.1 TauD/TfdA family dioxygenase [Amycolatopsis sp. CM201R]